MQPFIRVYNRMWKNNANTAIDIKTLGGSNSNVNSDVLIRIDSGGDPTAGVNTGTIIYNMNGTDRHIITATSFGINTITPEACALNMSGNMFCSGKTYAGGLRIGGFDVTTLHNETRELGITTLNNIFISNWNVTSRLCNKNVRKYKRVMLE